MPDKRKVSAKGYPIFTGYKISGFYPEYMYDKSVIIVVARGVGGTGDVKLAPARSFITNLSIIVDIIESKIVNKKYLQLLLNSMNLRSLDSGSAQSQITITALSNVEIDLPSKKIQNQIANKINLLERKIELNNQINDNLLNLLDTIYRHSWANHPNKAKKTLGDLFTTNSTTFKVKDHYNEKVWHFSIPNFDNEKYPTLDLVNDIKSNKTIVKPYSVLISKLNPSVKRIWAPNATPFIHYTNVCSTEFIPVSGRNIKEQAVLFAIVNNDSFINYLASNATGSTNSRQRVKPSDIFSYVLPMDVDPLLEYQDQFGKILNQVQLNQSEINHLGKLKAELLKKFF